jgi:phospholipid/cholesterol/gamma-HCH transport system substrate-binding protein
MRRSLREATIGFTLLTALAGGIGLWFWVSGAVFGQRTWSFRLRFDDAAGLSPQSSVSFRGVVVGAVRRVRADATGVRVDVQILEEQLRLPRPIVAQVRSGSLLGGDPEIALISEGPARLDGLVAPLDKRCDPIRQVCAGDLVQGVPSPSLSSVMGQVEELLTQARGQNLVGKVSETTTAVTTTSKAFAGTARRADRVLDGGDGLVNDLRGAVQQAQPVLANLRRATDEANVAMGNAKAASQHVRNITAAFDNPKTLAELRNTLSNAEQLTRRIDAIGGDVQKLSGDPVFVSGLRSVTLGLGKFFDELYPEIRPSPAPAGTGSGDR